ncbi:specifically androgen-regulated gene protein [Xenentodon cancila]
MPKSDTWPGGAGMETVNSMDSAGSCDSVVSGNSGCSDDSLEHLSAEEKACLMFLEETIESLDAEEDSGLSNDEPDQLPNLGNLATKLADLSASMCKSKFNSSQKPASKDQIKKNVDTSLMQSYMVPTPLVVASGSLGSVTSTKPVPPTGNSMSQSMPKNDKFAHKRNVKPTAPPISSELNVVVPASTKPNNHPFRTAEGPLPRGPLSYDALFHLRRNASTKKTPLCPTVDHTIDFDKCHPATVKDPNFGNFQRSDKFRSEVSKSKTEPPAVTPKPNKIPTNIPEKTQIKGQGVSHNSNGIKHATDPQVVRLEALQKLGLLKDQEPEDGAVGPPPPAKCHSSLDPTPKNLFRDPFYCNPSRSPSFYSSQMPKNKILQTSASFHHHSRHDRQPTSESHHPSQSSGLKRAGLERSTSLDNHANSGNGPEPQGSLLAKPVKTTTTDKPASEKPSNPVGYTVMVVPGMGADRKEALRKLGLLKN